MSFILVIPARYESKRFPGKLLKKIKGKEIISYVWEACISSTKKENVLIATDSEKIKNFCKVKAYNYMMTSSKCLTGTDRIYEVSKKIKKDVYINVQGDQPMLDIKDLKSFISFAIKNKNSVTTCITKINNESEYWDKGIPKMVFDNKKNLLFSSRSPIPGNKYNNFVSSYKHHCIFSFPRKDITKFGKTTSKTFFEYVEDLEINRFLELGINVKLYETKASPKKQSIDINTPSDLTKARRFFK